MLYREELLTEWFPPEVKPVNSGVYLTKIGNFTRMTACQYWDGEDWGLRCVSPNAAIRNNAHTISSRYQDVYWRGLKEKPIE